MQYKNKTRTMAVTALMAALMAVISPFIIPVGAIPFSLAVFAVFLSGAMLPPLSAVVSVAVYVMLGLVGLPVFSGFRGGPQVLAGATGGYIAGYFFLALATALGAKLFKSFAARFACALAGLAVMYFLGTLWYSYITGASFVSGLMVCVVPFIIPDIIKGVLALGLAHAVQKRIKKEMAV